MVSDSTLEPLIRSSIASQLISLGPFSPLHPVSHHDERVNRWNLTPSAAPDDCLYALMNLATGLAAEIQTQPKRHLSHRAVACVLVTKSLEVLAVGQNSNAQNKTLHAEVNMVQTYYLKTRQLLPAGCKIITTLKPCKMCASMIWHCSAEPAGLEVIYREEDEGCYSKRTILDERGSQRRLTFTCP